MKIKSIGVILSAAVVVGVVGAGCDKNEPTAAKPDSDAKVEAAAVTPAAAETKAPAWLGEFFGDKVVLADGSEVSTDTLAGKTLGIYFSAHWCPPCRGFTPVLVETYNELTAAGKSFDLVFVSSDRSKEEMANYMTETKMPWKGLPYDKRDKKKLLGQKFEIQGIPTLIIVDKDGKVITASGRMDISSKGAAAFDSWK